jgi:hypothetical protein
MYCEQTVNTDVYTQNTMLSLLQLQCKEQYVYIKSHKITYVLSIAQLNLKFTYGLPTTEIALYSNLWLILYQHLFPRIINRLIGVQRYSIFSCMCPCFVDRCVCFCTFFFWPLYYQSLFELRILITPLVFSSSSLVTSILLMARISL